MRTTDSTQEAALAALHRTTWLWIEVENASGTFKDLTDLGGVDWVSEAQVNWNEDDPISAATIVLRRETDALSLAPLIEGSALNVNDAASYAPLVHAGREVRIYTATVAQGTSKASAASVREMLWRGTIDEPEWGSRLVVTARDPGALLNDTIIETTRTYGDNDDPVPVETVMQAILDDNATELGENITLYVEGTPSFGVYEYELGNVSVLEALRALADLFGWSIRYKWNDSEQDFVLTLYEPARTNTVPVWTFGPDDYYRVNNISLSRANVRNAGEVVYTDLSGAQQTVSDTRPASISEFGRRFIRLDERGGSIRTSTQANTYLDAVLDDTATPSVVQSVEGAFFWPAELGDLYTWEANGVHYDKDQDYATFGITHVLNATTCRTVFEVTGQPKGGYKRWLAREAIVTDPDYSLLELEPGQTTATTQAFDGKCGVDVTHVWVYARLFEAPVTETDLLDQTETPSYLLDVLEPDSDHRISYTFDIPDEGFRLFVVFRPYGVSSGGYWTAGPARTAHIDPLTKIQPIVDSDDHETATHGYFWIKVQERGLALTGITYGRQTSPSNIVQGLAPTRGPGDASVVTGGTLGEGEYEAEVALPQGWQSWLWFDLVFEGVHTMRVMSPPLGPNRTPAFAGTVPIVTGTRIAVHGDNTRSIAVERKTGSGSWRVDRDTTLPESIDVALQDDSGNPGLSSGTETYIITLYSDPIAGRDGETMTAQQTVSVTAAGSSATYSLDIMTVSAPPIDSTIGTVEYKASDSTPSISTRRRVRVDFGPWGSWVDVPGASPDPAPTTTTQYSLPGLPTARERTGQLDPLQYQVDVEVEGTLLDGGTEHDVKVRSFSYTTNADDV